MISQYAAIDSYATKQLHAQSEELNTTLKAASERCRAHGLPEWDILSSHGKFLMLQVRLRNAQRILEIGCLGGHSSIWFSSAGPHVRVTTVEVDERFAAVAQENLNVAGVAHQVELINQDAKTVIPALKAEIEKGAREKYEFVFIDADKENNWFYFDQVVGMCEARACIVVHCSLWECDFAAPFEKEKIGTRKGSRELIERAGQDPRVDAVLVQTVPETSYHSLIAIVK